MKHHIIVEYYAVKIYAVNVFCFFSVTDPGSDISLCQNMLPKTGTQPGQAEQPKAQPGRDRSGAGEDEADYYVCSIYLDVSSLNELENVSLDKYDIKMKNILQSLRDASYDVI